MNSLLGIAHAAGRVAAFYVLLLGLGLTSLGWNLVAVALYPLLGARRAQTVGRSAISGGYRTFWAVAQRWSMMRIDASALGALRNEPGGLIVVANHPSMLDALLVVAELPRAVCIMKASLLRNPFLGAGALLARYIANSSARGMVRDAVESVREGAQLVVFPEGTRTVQRPLNAFVPGITLIAQRTQAPIQSVIIETDSPYLTKGWPIWRVPPLPVCYRLRLGRRFAVPAEHVNHAALLHEIESYFRGELKA